MKKRRTLAIVTMVALSLAACGNKEEQLDVSTATVSLEEAVETFHHTYSNAKLSSIELSEEKSKLMYSIDGFDETSEYTVHINESNEVAHQEEEKREPNEQYQELVLADYITVKDALAKAAQATEVNDLTATGWSLETENGTVVYSVQFEDAQKEVEVMLDAKTGEQLFVETDN
ncbi:PepSY domain-containing protein [Lysinibacillus piscis]|uniref:PepSY domain-containing protein n=1 Tax=Lysinibacillus piscis TaxID=2518931 RepID=A0ABQ5NL63_9BACI|nr:PepSY domain-containing protein [Lysinibacillus sp. KH24]GLC89096.1 hypothetical protein LYSBPC_22230 [Lysinibacillus sp. KH24]